MDSPQKVLTNNLFTSACLCPDTKRLLVLVDTDSLEHVNEKRMRGEVLAVSKKAFESMSTAPELLNLHVLNEDWKSGLKDGQSIPYG